MTDEEALKFAKEQIYIFGGTMKEFLQFVIDKLGKPQGEWEEDAFCIICPFCGMPIDDEVRYLYPDNFDLNFCPNCGKKLRWKGEEYGRD